MADPTAEVPLQKSIDLQLGDARDRYFGSGFSRVEHTATLIAASETQGSFEVATHYPDDWSKKGEKLQAAHLSSIDALVLAARMVELWLQENGLADRVPGAWFSFCELRPGRAPVDVSEPFIASLQVSDLGGHDLGETTQRSVLDALCRLGSFEVAVTLQIPPPPKGEPASELEGGHYFARGYRSVPRRLGVVTWTTDSQAECPIRIGDCSQERFSGIESEHGNVASFVDATLIAAQIGQVLLYDLDNVQRGETETMWLRRATFSRDHPPSGQNWEGVATVDMVRTQRLERSGNRWRTIHLSARVAEIEVLYSLTHQLRKSTLANGGSR